MTATGGVTARARMRPAARERVRCDGLTDPRTDPTRVCSDQITAATSHGRISRPSSLSE